MAEYYKLNEDKTVSPCNLLEWCEQLDEMHRNDTKHVASTDIGDYWVSTVWLGMNHNWGARMPLVFETMVFKGDWYDEYCARHATWDEAIAGHQKAIEWIKNGCKDEE